MCQAPARPAGATHVIQSRTKKRTLYLACARIPFPPSMQCWCGLSLSADTFPLAKNVHFPFSAAAQVPGNIAWGRGVDANTGALGNLRVHVFRSGREGIAPRLAPSRAPNESRVSVRGRGAPSMGMDGPAIKYEARKHARSATCTAHNTAQDDTRQHSHHITQHNTRDKRKVTEKKTITAHPASYTYIYVLTVFPCRRKC